MSTNEIRINSMCKFDYESIPIQYRAEYEVIFPENEPILFLGEIPNMPGHCILSVKGQILFGYHIENFIELSEDET